jgi:hypothetical protein
MKWFGCIHCDWCGNSGPIGKSESEAVKDWNATAKTDEIRRLKNGSRCLKEMALNVELYGLVQIWKEAAEALVVGDCPPMCSKHLGCTLDICKVHEGVKLLKKARELDLQIDVEKTSIHEERDQLRDRVAELEKQVVMNGERERMLSYTKRLKEDLNAKTVQLGRTFAALSNFGKHDSLCGVNSDTPPVCNCGLASCVNEASKDL